MNVEGFRVKSLFSIVITYYHTGLNVVLNSETYKVQVIVR